MSNRRVAHTFGAVNRVRARVTITSPLVTSRYSLNYPPPQWSNFIHSPREVLQLLFNSDLPFFPQAVDIT